MEELLNLAKSQGIWAALFVALFIYTIKDAKVRETKYQELADKLSTIINDEIKHLRDTITNFMCKDK